MRCSFSRSELPRRGSSSGHDPEVVRLTHRLAVAEAERDGLREIARRVDDTAEVAALRAALAQAEQERDAYRDLALAYGRRAMGATGT